MIDTPHRERWGLLDQADDLQPDLDCPQCGPIAQVAFSRGSFGGYEFFEPMCLECDWRGEPE